MAVTTSYRVVVKSFCGPKKNTITGKDDRVGRGYYGCYNSVRKGWWLGRGRAGRSRVELLKGEGATIHVKEEKC